MMRTLQLCGSYKFDGLSDFTYTRLCRRSASRPARTHSPLSLARPSARQGFVVEAEAEENRRSSSRPRTDVAHQLFLCLTRQRADRPFLSLFSLFSAASDCYAADSRACTCKRVRNCVLRVRAPIGGHYSRLDQSKRSFHLRPSSTRAFSQFLLPVTAACASTLFTTHLAAFP